MHEHSIGGVSFVSSTLSLFQIHLSCRISGRSSAFWSIVVMKTEILMMFICVRSERFNRLHALPSNALNVLFSTFNLLSFRKTCLVCKCPRDTHAIYQEQVTSVKERLGFKPTANLSTLDAKQMGYTWIPPGITTTNKVSILHYEWNLINNSFMDNKRCCRFFFLSLSLIISISISI